jgi:hypothetical protein
MKTISHTPRHTRITPYAIQQMPSGLIISVEKGSSKEKIREEEEKTSQP